MGRVQQSRMQNAGPGGMPGMYPPQGPAVFYPMQGGGRGGNMAYYQPQMGGQMGGQRRFPLISEHDGVGDQAGKITGMLLDMDTHELLHLIESPDALSQKVTEAINVLVQHQIMEQPSTQ